MLSFPLETSNLSSWVSWPVPGIFSSGINLILVVHLKGIKILKSTFYCECYISQIKIIDDKNHKYNILDEYSFIETENDDDIDIFDEEYLNEIKEKKNKIILLKKEITECEINLTEKKNLLNDLE